jgi:hypothetical protein
MCPLKVSAVPLLRGKRLSLSAISAAVGIWKPRKSANTVQSVGLSILIYSTLALPDFVV